MTTVLVVEDEGIIARDLRVTLERLGYRVPEVAATGLDAIDAAHRLEPDVVLMDIHLRGDMDGTEAARRIREDLRPAIIYLTAYADDETLDRAQRAEPYGYLVKPFDEETLRTTIETALRRRDAQLRTDRTLKVQAAAMDHVREGLLLVARDGTVEHANESARAALDGDPTGAVLHAWRPLGDEGGHLLEGSVAWGRLRAEPGPHTWRIGGRACTVSVQDAGDAYVLVLTPGSDVRGHRRRSRHALGDLAERARDLV